MVCVVVRDWNIVVNIVTFVELDMAAALVVDAAAAVLTIDQPVNRSVLDIVDIVELDIVDHHNRKLDRIVDLLCLNIGPENILLTIGCRRSFVPSSGVEKLGFVDLEKKKKKEKRKKG